MIWPPVIFPGDGTIRITDSAETVLPDPLSPTKPNPLSGPHVEAQSLHGVDRAALQAERDAEVADLQQGGLRCPGGDRRLAGEGRRCSLTVLSSSEVTAITATSGPARRAGRRPGS